jgi:hypothetical protein
MFVWLRVHGFESSVNKVFQKEKLVNSKTINLQSSLKELVQQELTSSWRMFYFCQVLCTFKYNSKLIIRSFHSDLLKPWKPYSRGRVCTADLLF